MTAKNQVSSRHACSRRVGRGRVASAADGPSQAEVSHVTLRGSGLATEASGQNRVSSGGLGGPVTVSAAIARRQNTSRSLILLRAAAVVHRRIQLAHGASMLVSILLAVLGLVAKQIPSMSASVSVAGAIWATTYAILVVSNTKRLLRTGAMLQEAFDCSVFDMPWNVVAVGKPVPEEEVSRISRLFHGNERELRNYYLVADLPFPYDVLFCLEQNLAWGPRVRRRYATAVATLAIAWLIVGAVVAIIQGWTVSSLLAAWLVPSSGLLLLCLDTYRAQVSSNKERARVLDLLRVTLDGNRAEPATPTGTTEFVRRVQDALFSMRQQQPRVPSWFFRQFHNRDEADFRSRMRQLEDRPANA